MKKEGQQLGFGGEFAPAISGKAGTIEADKPKAKEQTLIIETSIPKEQFRLEHVFPIISNQVETPASAGIKLTSFEGQVIFNKEIVTDFFHRLFPQLFRIERGEKIIAPFKSGGCGEVKLSTSTYVIFDEHSAREDRLFKLEVPALVEHPRYGTTWTLGFKSTLDPDTKTKVREFDHPKIFYNGPRFRKVTEKDLDEFVDIWRRRTARETT